jgi:hypothetical protein
MKAVREGVEHGGTKGLLGHSDGERRRIVFDERYG